MQAADVELWCDYPQPSYYAGYRQRLPPMRFGKASNQVRFPAAILDIALPMANAIAVSQVTAQLERELAILGETEDLLDRVRATLINRNEIGRANVLTPVTNAHLVCILLHETTKHSHYTQYNI